MSQKSQDSAAKQTIPKPDLAPAVEGLTTEGQVVRAAAALQRLATAPDDPLAPGDVLALQRTVGNQVVQRTLAEGFGPGRGLASTSAPAAVQRTDTGIASDETVEQYAEGARGIESEWANLSAKERTEKLGALANAALESIKVPAVTIAMADLGSSNGVFTAAAWTLKVNKTIVSKDSVTEAELARVSNTFYHEARHAEQYFRVARYLGTLGRSASNLAKYLNIPGRIATAAKDQPLGSTSILDQLLGTEPDDAKLAQEIDEAKRWARSMSPRGRRRYTKIVNELDAAESALKDAVAAYKASPTEENKEKVKAAGATYKKKYRAYRRISIERDAFSVGGEAEEAFTESGSQQSQESQESSSE